MKPEQMKARKGRLKAMKMSMSSKDMKAEMKEHAGKGKAC